MKSYTIEVDRERLIKFLSKMFKTDFRLMLHRGHYFELFTYFEEGVVEVFEFFKKYCGEEYNYNEVFKYKKLNYFSIKKDGIKEPVDIFIGNGVYKYNQFQLQVKNNWYFHGFHRLAIAEKLNIKKIPVKFITEDKNLWILSDILFNIYSGKDQYTIYQPIEHPYFELCNLHNSYIDDKYTMIKEFLTKEEKILDFGCNNGYITRCATKDGFNIEAIDLDKDMCKTQEYFNNIGLVSIKFNCTAIERYIKQLGENKYTVIALSLFHHSFENDKLKRNLNEVIIPFINEKVDKLFIELDNYEQFKYIYDKINLKKHRLIYTDLKKQRQLYYLR